MNLECTGGSLVPRSYSTLERPWTVAHYAPLCIVFSRQKHWSGLSFPSPGYLPHPGMEHWSPGQQADFLPSKLHGSPLEYIMLSLKSQTISIYMKFWKRQKYNDREWGWKIISSCQQFVLDLLRGCSRKYFRVIEVFCNWVVMVIKHFLYLSKLTELHTHSEFYYV